MKKTSLIINVILIIAVIVLFVLHFTHSESSPQKTNVTARADTAGNPALFIAYVNMDTLMANYDFSVDLQQKLGNKQKTSEDKLNTRGKKWQNKVTEYQNNLKRGLVTRSEAQKIEQQLSQEQQEILKMKDDLASKLMEEQQVSTRKVLYSIMDYLDEYAKAHHYKYILSTTTLGGTILFGDKDLDVTQDVLAGLNKKYESIRDSVLNAN